MIGTTNGGRSLEQALIYPDSETMNQGVGGTSMEKVHKAIELYVVSLRL